MKSRRPTRAKSVRNFSDAGIAKRYSYLQNLRDEVRKAETRALHALYVKGATRPADHTEKTR
jgi:hypothetical protein